MRQASASDIVIQDPEWDDSKYLLEEILLATQGATGGVGVFAFASAGGVKLLLEDPDFLSFIRKSPFELIVGMDAITDTKALDAISTTISRNGNLTARAFMGKLSGGIFHPKLCWFRHRSGAICVLGSGNLTPGGLRGNCEAFSTTVLASKQLRRWERTWRSWSDCHRSELLQLSDPDVQKRASENAAVKRVFKKLEDRILVERHGGRITVGRAKTGAAKVLLAEIPKGGTRWNQANFDLDTFRNFFGASPGDTQRIILTHIALNGQQGPQEVRPSVSVKSHNYRFELEAAANLKYPSTGRPIAVFVRVATRTFRYRLLMPGTSGYREASDYLNHSKQHLARSVRRMVTDVNALREEAFFRKLAE